MLERGIRPPVPEGAGGPFVILEIGFAKPLSGIVRVGLEPAPNPRKPGPQRPAPRLDIPSGEIVSKLGRMTNWQESRHGR